ncbi:RPA-related protein RADX-like [Centruroides vittatus]|uniref:RPA-related protein RADX-like n=1 Tax=Centruroides vittatus TaxID=120091 RepID=UPI003510C6CC
MIRPYPPVLVSVILQGKLHHYGKNSKNNPFPFQGYFDVADETGIVSAVLWDSVNINIFSKIKPGAVIFIQNYNVTNKYSCSSTSVLRHKLRKLEKYPLELKINKNSSVHIVDRCFLKEHSNTKRLFPKPQYWFATRKILGNLPTETNVDIIGLTVYVGCYIRERCLDIHGNPRGGFWTYRWIELIDSTSSLPIILQVYVNDQLDIHKELKPGQILMCSQLHLVHVPFVITKSFQRRDFYLTTTRESTLMICKENEFEKTNEFLNLIDMMKSKDIMPQLKESVFRMGGIYNYPPCQKSLEFFKASIPRERLNFLTPSDVWKQEFNSLSYKEVRRINVTGFIVQVIYFSCMKNGWIENTDNQIPKLIFNDIHRLHSRKYDILGNFILESNAFAHQYSPENEKVLRNWLSFAPFSADQNTDENLEELKDISIYYPGYYRIDIAAENYNVIINSFLFVEPSNLPHPSFVKLLSGDFSMKSKKFYGLHYDSIELKNQFDSVQETVFEIFGKKMLFILDVYSNTPGNADVLLKRAFPYKEEINQSV